MTSDTNSIPLDLSSENFLYNKYTPKILNESCTENLKANIKQLHKINSLIYWHNQQRISIWNTQLNNINWNYILEYLTYNDKPKSLSTNPKASNLKNFKVKMLAEELPTDLLLHFRNPKKYKNHLCPRCYAESEDIAHLLSCIANNHNPKRKIKEIITNIASKHELILNQTDLFINALLDLIQRKKHHSE